MSNRLPIIAAEIAAEHQAVARAQGEFVKHAVAAGNRLLEAKGLVPHGAWADWLETNVPTVSARTAQRYMRAANRTGKNDIVSYSTLKEIIEVKRDHNASGLFEEWLSEINAIWAEASPAVQRWFLDVVEIVGTKDPIPETYLHADRKMIRDTARGLRELRGRA